MQMSVEALQTNERRSSQKQFCASNNDYFFRLFFGAASINVQGIVDNDDKKKLRNKIRF